MITLRPSECQEQLKTAAKNDLKVEMNLNNRIDQSRPFQESEPDFAKRCAALPFMRNG